MSELTNTWKKTMDQFRSKLDKEGIEWVDHSGDLKPSQAYFMANLGKPAGLWASEISDYSMLRTWFDYRGYKWSVIIGYGSYGGNLGLLEVMSDAINGGQPVGSLTPDDVMDYVLGNKEYDPGTNDDDWDWID